jgi:hypothetical protein
MMRVTLDLRLRRGGVERLPNTCGSSFTARVPLFLNRCITRTLRLLLPTWRELRKEQ